MDSVKQLIFAIQKQPELYVGSRSLPLVEAFINGWLHRDEQNVADADLLGDFQAYIQRRFQVNSAQSWAAIIRFYSNDEREALERFFEEFEGFVEEQETK